MAAWNQRTLEMKWAVYCHGLEFLARMKWTTEWLDVPRTDGGAEEHNRGTCSVKEQQVGSADEPSLHAEGLDLHHTTSSTC